MDTSYTTIRKGLQKDVLFKGLKAKYITYCLYLGFGAIILGMALSTFVPMVFALIVIVVLVALIFLVLLFYSKTYGANGFVKKLADRSKPDRISVTTSFENLLLWKRK